MYSATMTTALTNDNKIGLIDEVRNGINRGLRWGAFAIAIAVGFYALFSAGLLATNLLTHSLPTVAGLKEAAAVLTCGYTALAALAIPTLGFLKGTDSMLRFSALIALITGSLFACMI